MPSHNALRHNHFLIHKCLKYDVEISRDQVSNSPAAATRTRVKNKNDICCQMYQNATLALKLRFHEDDYVHYEFAFDYYMRGVYTC